MFPQVWVFSKDLEEWDSKIYVFSLVNVFADYFI